MLHFKISRSFTPWYFVIAWVLVLMWTGDGECQNPAVPAKPAANKPQPGQPRYWTTQWAMDDVDVAKLSRRLGLIGIDTGLDLDGKISVKFQVGVPLTSPRDAAAYRFDGVMTSSSLVVDGVQLKNLSTAVVYRDGVATLKNLTSQFIDRESSKNLVGKIQGQGLVELVPRGDVTADVKFQQLSLAPVSDILAKFLVTNDSDAQAADLLPQAGDLSGELKFSVPLATAGRIDTYRLNGDFSGRGLKIAGLPPANFDAKQVRIESEVLMIDSFSIATQRGPGVQESTRLLGQASIPLSGTGEFEFDIAGDDVPVAAVATLVMQANTEKPNTIAEGKIDFRLTGKGQLNERIGNSNWNIQGTAASPRLRFAGIDLGTLEHDIVWTPTQFSIVAKRNVEDLPKSFRIGQLRCRYAIDAETLSINSIDASLFGGRLMGSARVPLDPSGILSAKLEMEGIHPTIQLTDSGVTGELSAALSGKLDWEVPVDAIGNPTEHQGQANLSLSDITLGDANVGKLKATASAASGELALSGSGTLFDGSITVETAAAMQGIDRWSDVTKRMTKMILDFDGVSLTRLFAIATRGRPDLTGLASGKLTITNFNRDSESTERFPDAEVKLQLSRLSHQSRLLSRSIRLAGKLQGDTFGIDSLDGDYAGGTAHVNGRVYLVDPSNRFHPRADLRLSASQIVLDRGLWFLGDYAEDYQGLASVTATLAGHQESIRVRGSVDGRELAIYGLSLGSAHSGIAADADIGRRHWKLRFPSVRSSQGGGQVEGELSLSSSRYGGRGVELASRWRTRRVDFSRLAKQLGQSNSRAQGEITGELSLGGKSIRTLDDLVGRFDLQLGRTRGVAIPGLVGMSRFLGPVSLATQTFEVGATHGVIGGGAVVIDEFWLGSDNALIQADGKVFLRSGRMDMNALIATGDYRDVSVNFTQLAQQYAFRSLLPTSAVLDVSELLRDRTLVVRVMGRVESPIIRLQPVETFREEAARFLLREGQRLIVAGITAEAAGGLITK